MVIVRVRKGIQIRDLVFSKMSPQEVEEVK